MTRGFTAFGLMALERGGGSLRAKG